VRLHAINTVDGPSTRSTRDRVRGWHGLTYLSRAGWGADEQLRFEPDGTGKFPTAFFDVQTLTVHHTVSANADPDPAATVRAIYFFQCITDDFGDIGYHLLIDRVGTVYEGRYSDPTRCRSSGHVASAPGPSMVNGAHVVNFNAGNSGVALLGDLTSTGPRRPAATGHGARAGCGDQAEPAGEHQLREPDQRDEPGQCRRSPVTGTGRRPSAQATRSTHNCRSCGSTWPPPGNQLKGNAY
jgi:hypothetical protein